MNTPNRNWNERYLTGDTPWLAHTLATPLLNAIQKRFPKGARILEIGCGHGQEAIALAKFFYDVTAVDLSEAAINRAKKNAKKENTHVLFQVFDVLHDINPFPLFDIVFDISVLHTIDNPKTRHKFAQAVTHLLKPNGYWINMSCLKPDVIEVSKSTGVKAPPALTKEELNTLSEDHFLLEEQISSTYQILRNGKCVSFPSIISVWLKHSFTLEI